MPPPVCERYNARARRSAPGGSSHKKRHSHKGVQLTPVETLNANAEIIVPKTQEQKLLDRREVIKQEVFLANQGASKKKQKQLEKYIDKKLKQEERVDILKKLATTQLQLPSTINLKSSSTLGSGKPRTAADLASQTEHLEVKKALDGRAGNKRRKRQRHGEVILDHGEQSSDEDSDLKSPIEEGTHRDSPIVIEEEQDSLGYDDEEWGGMDVPTVKIEEYPVVVKPAEVGGALRRNADGTVAMPLIIKREPKAPKMTRKQILQSWQPPEEIEEEEESSEFDSTDSSDDTNGDHGDSDGDSDSDSSNDEEMEESPLEELVEPTNKKRSFKEWAEEQIKLTRQKQVDRGDNDSNMAEKPAQSHIEAIQEYQALLGPEAKRRKLDHNDEPGRIHGPMGEKLKVPETEFAKHVQKIHGSKGVVKHVEVKRPDDVQEARLLLPVVAEEQVLMETVLLNPVVIICGETGSGKTTQVPQFLYEAGYGSPGSDNPGMIGITQPRRVAAVSMAARVGHELSLPSSKVSYQIRYDATTAPTTAIKFMTDGVLLREMATDFLLSRYSVVIVDEAHERSLNTDILIGTLSRVIKVREKMWLEGKPGVKPLRLIMMSATLRVSDFAENKSLFDTPPPIISINARQHPVTIHFNRKTHHDYVDQAVRKTIKIHKRLPPGGILIFLTGQNEIHGVCRKLEKRFGKRAIEERKKAKHVTGLGSLKVFPEDQPADEKDKPKNIGPSSQRDLEVEELELGTAMDENLAMDVDDVKAELDPEDLDTDEEDEKENQELQIDADESDVPMHVIPLYSLLAHDNQMKVFEPPPEGSRLVVVSTNVAETSLTIPGIRYVIDSGRAKERLFDPTSNIQTFQVSWVSKASAAQRAGRAGRTGPGHCYRLYSSALFENQFNQFSVPEIMRTPIDGVVLQMKTMGIDTVINFPFPTPPDRLALKKAEKVLTHLGALESTVLVGMLGQTGGRITELGKTMALFPVNPRFAKMLGTGMQHGCLPYVVAIISALSVGDPFLREEVIDQNQGEDESDDDVAIDGVGAEVVHIKSEEIKQKEIRKAKRQAFFRAQQALSGSNDGQSDTLRLLSVVGAYEYAGGTSSFCESHFLRPKAMEEIHKLRGQISNIVQTNFPGLDAGFKPTLPPPKPQQIKALRQLIAAGFIDQVAVRKDLVQPNGAGNKFASSRGVAYRAIGVDEDVFIHPSSVLFHSSPPDWVVWQEVVRSSKIWIKGLTVVNAAWLAHLGPSLCTFSKPIPVPAGMKGAKPGEVLVIPKYGPGWELPPIRKMKDT